MKFRLCEWKFNPEVNTSIKTGNKITLESIRLPNFRDDFFKNDIWGCLSAGGINYEKTNFWVNAESDNDKYLPKIDRKEFLYVIEKVGFDADVSAVRPYETHCVLPLIKTKENLFDLGYKAKDIILKDLVVYNSNELLLLDRVLFNRDAINAYKWDDQQTAYSGSKIEKLLNIMLNTIQKEINARL